MITYKHFNISGVLLVGRNSITVTALAIPEGFAEQYMVKTMKVTPKEPIEFIKANESIPVMFLIDLVDHRKGAIVFNHISDTNLKPKQLMDNREVMNVIKRIMDYYWAQELPSGGNISPDLSLN